MERELTELHGKVQKLNDDYGQLRQEQSSKDEAGAMLEGLKEQLSQ